jgi:hypothetical protein
MSQTVPDYQIDPHLRHDFPRQEWWGHQPGHVPLGRPPWLFPARSRPPKRTWRHRPRRVRRRTQAWLWRQQLRLGLWFLRGRLFRDEARALRLILGVVLLICLAQAFLLLLHR